MEQKNQILGNRLVVMSREDMNSLVNEMAQNIVTEQKTVLGTNSEWMVFLTSSEVEIKFNKL